MKDLTTADFTEFKWMPFVVGMLGLLFLRALVHGRIGDLIDVVVLYVYFGLFSLWSFGYKLYSYGHNLAPTASVKVPPFMPPLFGYKKLANFEVYSYPSAGSYALAAVGCGPSRRPRARPARGPPRGARGRPVGRMILPAVALLLALSGEEMTSAAAAAVEGRPAAGAVSSLQARVDAAPEGSVVEVGPGTYRGDLYLDRRITLSGRGRPRLQGSGSGSVVRIRAAGVVLEGFDIDGGGGGDLGRDSSGIHVAAKNVTVRDCRVSNALFGVYLREADGSAIERTSIRGIPGKDPGEKGSGIHVWNTDGFRLTGNTIVDVRDGFYIQSSSHGVIRGNTARDLRFGLHYMFSDDNLFEDNTFENGAAGTAIMYSKRIVFRRNRFLHNRGFASVGLLFKACEDVTAESNLIADNARGIFLEGSYRNLFKGNVVAESDVAIVLYDSCADNRFVDNSLPRRT